MLFRSDTVKFSSLLNENQVIANPIQLSGGLSYSGAGSTFFSFATTRGYLYNEIDCVTLNASTYDQVSVKTTGEAWLTRSNA